MSSYSELLRDPRWQRKRLEALNFADWRCDRCCDAESTLHVHHKRYVKGRAPWEYDLEELAVLCAHCHGVEHEQAQLRAALLSRLALDGPESIDDMLAMVCGFTASRGGPDEKLQQLAQQFGEQAPIAFAWGSFVGNLAWFGIASDGVQRLATLSQPEAQSEFLSELLELMRRHGVRFLEEREP